MVQWRNALRLPYLRDDDISSITEYSVIEWSAQRISSLPTEQIKDLRANATKKGATSIVELCDTELLRRKPPRKEKAVTQDRSGQFVSCFHFVCPKEKEITRNPDGTVWSGTWVVSEENAEMSLRYGGKVALHIARAELSYLQGVIKGWRRSPRRHEYSDGIPVRTQSGIDFLLEPTAEPLQWVGDATGEKGYEWSSKQETGR